MQQKLYALAFLTLVIAGASGCMSPPQDSDIHEHISGNYDAVSSCVYVAMSASRPGVTYADMRANGRAVIREVNQWTVIWQAQFTRIADRETQITVSGVPTIRGSDFYSRQVINAARQCAG